MRRLMNWLTLGDADLTIARAQLQELQNHLPLLYSLLVSSAALLAWIYFDFAPLWMTLGLLVFAAGVCMSRIPFWIGLRALEISEQDVLRHLRRTIWLSGVMAVFFIGWAMLLDGYGTAHEHAFSAIFIATAVICSMFCLMHLPQAATMVAVVVTPVYVGYYAYVGVDQVFFAISLNVVLVVLVMMKVLFRAFDTFTAMIRARNEISARHDEVEKLNAENERLANTDALTGLTNRRHFFAELRRWITDDQARFTLVLLDFDQFKPINDNHGHPAGDRLIAAIGDRLNALCNADVVISRLGGDEFGMLIRLDGPATDQCVQRARAAVTTPVLVGVARLSIGCSIGCARFPASARTVEDLFNQADQALYVNKRASRPDSGVHAL